VRRGVAVIAGVLTLIAGAGVGQARSPLVSQLNSAATRYHEDPTRLDVLREGLEQAVRDDPDAANFTGLRVGLAKVLIKKNEIAEARRELQAVVDAKNPTNRADWTMKDAPEARTLLDSLPRP
jgi:tetratricopeptide repeat protein